MGKRESREKRPYTTINGDIQLLRSYKNHCRLSPFLIKNSNISAIMEISRMMKTEQKKSGECPHTSYF